MFASIVLFIFAGMQFIAVGIEWNKSSKANSSGSGTAAALGLLLGALAITAGILNIT